MTDQILENTFDITPFDPTPFDEQSRKSADLMDEEEEEEAVETYPNH